MALRILVIKPSSIGDVLHTFPPVALIRAAHPDAEIDWVVNDSLANVVRLCPGISRIISFPRKDVMKLNKLKAFISELRENEYDVAIDFQGLLRSGIITGLSRSKSKVGFANARECAPIFYKKSLKLQDNHTHAVDKNIALARFALEMPADIQVPPPAIDISQDFIAEITSVVPGNDGMITIAVCFASRWHSKNWSGDFIANVLDETSKIIPNLRAVLIGSKDDQELGKRIMSSARCANLVDLSGKTSFGGLAALLSRSQAMFTVDSGPMHLAAAIGVPCIAMFGSTDYVLTGPYGPSGFHSIISSKCEKAPCFKHDCPLHHDCSDGISALETAKIIASKLRK